MSARNIKMIIEYDGGRYDGWSRLGKDESTNTIENKIVEVLGKMVGEKVELFAAVRTEKGVHAHCQVVNFKSSTNMKLYEIRNYLNRYLPQDIAVVNVSEVPERFHSTLNAKKKTYMYRIDTRDVPNVFDRKFVYYSFNKLDISAMQEAATYILGEHDFKRFSTVKKNKSTVKNIYDVEVYDDGQEIQISITANDFLHNMARIIIGVLIEVGSGRLDICEVKNILEGKESSYEMIPAEAKGLFLEDVTYE